MYFRPMGWEKVSHIPKAQNVSKQRYMDYRNWLYKNENLVASLEDEQEGQEIGCVSPTINSK